MKRPFTPSHEVMTRSDALYDRLLVLDWNITSRAQGRGSAIFFHQARINRGTLQPTEGCIALAPDTFRRMSGHLSRVDIVQVL